MYREFLMSDDLFVDDDDTNDGAGETNLVKQLRKALKDANKKASDLEAENATLKSTHKQRTVADVLADKKVNPKLAKFILRDLDGDVTPEAIDSWLAENGELFGVQPESKDEVADEVVQSHTRMAELELDGLPPERQTQIASDLQNAKSADDILKILSTGSLN